MAETAMLRVFLAFLVLEGGAWPFTPAAAQLAPHRAFYDLTLAEAAGGLVDARGAFAVEWRAACAGTTSRQRLWFVGQTDEGGTFDYDVRFSTWESADHARMRFSMRGFAGGTMVEEFRGTASMPSDGGAGRAVYSVPEGVEVALPPGTVFPTEHIDRLIALARDRERIVTFALFDGAGGIDDALAEVTAVIGDAKSTARMGAEPAWPMALAYYPIAADDVETPEFEISFDLTARGVMERVVLDYGDFALRARLDELELLSRPHCD